MPLAREPSQRSKWMRWHNNNNAAAAAAAISKNEPSEIIHLGGSRVSTTPSDDRPVTQWFTMSPPEPPAVLNSTQDSEDHHDKQLPSPPPSASSSMLSPPPLNIGAAPKGKPPAPVQIPSSHQRLLSPLHTDASSNGQSVFSPPLTASSAYSRGSAAMFSPTPNPFSCNPVSPTSSVSSHDSPEEHGLRRSQSVADIKDRSKDRSRPNTGGSRPRWRPFPNSTPSESDGEMDEAYSRQTSSSRAESGSSSKTYPPPSHPPPSGPLPAISQVLSMGDQQQQQQQQLPSSTSTPPPPPQNLAPPPPTQSSTTNPMSSLTRSSSLKSPKISLVVLPKTQPMKTTRHTREERLWLHKNYRGEANFLRAWGLSIDNEEDREEGAALLRELVQSEQEAKWIKSQQQQQTVTDRAEQITAKNNNTNDGLSPLQVIVEESNTGHSPRQLPPYGYKYPGVMVEETPVTAMGAAVDQEDGVNLRIPVKAPWSAAQQQQHLARIAAAKEHARSESEHSVLGAYLDVRMSRLD
ncbi:uncharacterized protein PG998_005893 [Apiospora kogelbergensis]|uniref:uncharacterized protein n=1 Tax=Apiospora kogelbergensis TaxID=1337665 RepID=UPI00312E8034